MGRRELLVAGGGVVAATALAGVGVASGVLPVPRPIRRLVQGTGRDGVIPDAPAGLVRHERVRSRARGRAVGLWTAVPAGHGDGAGLPVCLVLHGASATTGNYDEFGFANFLTDAVRTGAAPFVLAGADGGLTRWEGDGAGDDPQAMLTDELPAWCSRRGFDTDRLAAYGWSMGGYGALRLAQRNPGLLRAVAALSPAVSSGDSAFGDVTRLEGERTALWCGRSDQFSDGVRELARAIEPRPAIASFGKGSHTRGYWNRVTPRPFSFVAAALTD